MINVKTKRLFLHLAGPFDLVYHWGSDYEGRNDKQERKRLPKYMNHPSLSFS